VSVLAFDLGASGGRALVGDLKNDQLEYKEIHRFSNDPVQVGQHLHWDILRLFHEIKQGIVKANLEGYQLESLAIDSWAVDFGLLDKNGELLGNPYHYRDHHTDGVMEEIFSFIDKKDIFAHTGIQFLPFNTIYQLAALKKADSSILDQSATLLMIPDLLRYFLTDEKVSEFTNATTTQLFNPTTMNWDEEILTKLGVPSHIFCNVAQPGTKVGSLTDSVSKELNVPSISVVTIGEHDTASAVAGVPANTKDFAYLSCGTWSLMGTELDQPMINDEAFKGNFTNEGGVNDTFRFLKNIMGLWILQECKRIWEKEGKAFSFGELVEQANTAKAFQSFIDPDDLQFLNPNHMPQQIKSYCKKTNQVVPETVGEIVRCVMESLALKYRYVLENIEQIVGKRFKGLNMVGGGINNELLCQFTANAIGKPAWAGPTEASAIGNLMLQFISLGKVEDIYEARNIIRNSISLKTHEPEDQDVWDKAYHQFCDKIGLQG
jgi:rhamnulokinase